MRAFTLLVAPLVCALSCSASLLPIRDAAVVDASAYHGNFTVLDANPATGLCRILDVGYEVDIPCELAGRPDAANATLHKRDSAKTNVSVGTNNIRVFSIAYNGQYPRWPEHYTKLWDSLYRICDDYTGCNPAHQECWGGVCINADGFYQQGERERFIKLLRTAFDKALVRTDWQHSTPVGNPPTYTITRGVDEVAPDYFRANTFGPYGGRTMRVNLSRQIQGGVCGSSVAKIVAAGSLVPQFAWFFGALGFFCT